MFLYADFYPPVKVIHADSINTRVAEARESGRGGSDQEVGCRHKPGGQQKALWLTNHEASPPGTLTCSTWNIQADVVRRQVADTGQAANWRPCDWPTMRHRKHIDITHSENAIAVAPLCENARWRPFRLFIMLCWMIPRLRVSFLNHVGHSV